MPELIVLINFLVKVHKKVHCLYPIFLQNILIYIVCNIHFFFLKTFYFYSEFMQLITWKQGMWKNILSKM